MRRFYRLCVDLDHAAQVIGASYEVHDDREVLTFGTVLVGPFDTPAEALALAQADVTARHGIQEALPF